MNHLALLKYEHTLNLPEDSTAQEEVAAALFEWLTLPQYLALTILIEYGPLSIGDIQAAGAYDASLRGESFPTLSQMFSVMLGLSLKGLVERELLTPVPSALKGHMA